MSKWKEVRFGEFIKVQGGYAFKSKDFKSKDFKSNGVPIVKIKNLVNNKIDLTEADYVDKKFLEIAKNYIINNGDVLISMTGSNVNQSNSMVGKVAYVNENIPTCLLNQRVGRLILKKDNIDLKYIFYFLSQKEVQYYLASNATGSANQANINSSIIENLNIPYKDYITTKKIADILYIIDEKIETLQNINETLEEMAKAIFKSWFVDFEIVKAKANGKTDSEIAKEFGISKEIVRLFPSEFETSEIGKIPKGWGVIYLKDGFDFLEGPGIRNWQYTSSGIKFLNIRCIKNGDLDLSSTNFISKDEVKNRYSHFLLSEKDMIVSTSGTLGKYAIIRKQHLPLLLNTSIIRFRPKNKKYYSFMYSYLTSNKFYENLLKYATGSVQLNFGPTHLKKIKIVYPNIDILKFYENKTKIFYEKLLNNRDQIQTLQELRDTLLPKLINGEMEVEKLDIKGIE